jgi:hypothetical protein
MTNNEKMIRDRLYNMEAAYPADMWDRISAELPPQKEHNKWWLFFIIFLLALAVPGTMYWTQNNADHKGFSESAFLSPDQNQKKYQEPIIADINHTGEDDAEPLAVVTSTDQSVKRMVQKATARTENTAEKVNRFLPANAADYASAGLSMASELLSKDELSNAQLLTPSGTPENASILPSSIILRQEQPELPALNFKSLLVSGEERQFEAPECPTFGFEGSRGLYFDLYYSHDYGFRSLEAKSQEFNLYATERDNSESSLYSFSAGVRISYISSSGLGLKTGFNYSQINEKFEYLDPDASLIRTIITIDTLLVGGVPTVVRDTSTIRIPGSLDITAYNKYRFFDIPILATYESYLTDRLYYTVNGGVLINLSFAQKGRFLDPGGQPAWFSSSLPSNERFDAYKSSAGLSIYGSLGLHYVLNAHIDLILEPNFRLYAGSITREDYPLKQKWITGGIITGIRYKF